MRAIATAAKTMPCTISGRHRWRHGEGRGQLQVPLLLVRRATQEYAVTVDQVVGNREIVVKPGGPQLLSVPGIFGATIMGDGRWW